MKLIIGLGNPGKKYDNTRHNIGFRILDHLAASESIKFKKKVLFKYAALANKAVIIKPLTYMNLSGKAALEARKFFPVSDTLVVFDDIYLPLGAIRIRQKGSDGGHKGVRSIFEQLSPVEFVRLKIGVGSPSCRKDESISESISWQTNSDYVLANFSKEEEKVLAETVSLSVDLIKVFIENGYEDMVSYYSRIYNV